MSLNAGSKLGPYEIIGAIGAGGMGEVYRARDTRLDRTVAIKVLPSHLSTHPGLRQRLEREARAISQLSHPHICTLFDVGHQDGVDFLVLEYLEGETLEHRLQRGPLPPEQLLTYAIQIADALETAHCRGIVHRDLKPGNVMLTKSGTKLLDFGLARAVADPQAAAELATLVTQPERPLTAEGSLVGTFQYMAPEQLEGAPADQRSDIFAFGVLLHEMATGKPAFSGKTRASLIASILSSEPPPISTLQPVTPPELDRVVRNCLTKDPDQRWQSVHDIKLELEWVRDRVVEPLITAVQRPARWVWALGTLLLMAVAFFAGGQLHRTAFSHAPVYRTALPPPQGHSYAAYYFAISPDGTRFAFTATSRDGSTTLWMRSLATDTSQEFSGTEGTTDPFWSPDSRYIAFFAQSKLKKVEVATGAVQNICDAIFGRGGTWNREGVILFAPYVGSPLQRVPADGGQPVPATRLPEGSGQSHRWPLFLPDGRHFLYMVDWSEGHDGVYLGSLDSLDSTLLSKDIHGNLQFSFGHLLYVRDGTLLAQPFDPEKLSFTGDPVPIVNQDIEQDQGFGVAGFSVSDSGALVYQSRRSYSSRLVWFDRSGKEQETVGPAAAYEPRFSPDGRRLAVTLDAAFNGHPRVHVVDPIRGTVTSITPESDINQTPLWSPDASHLAYAAFDNSGEFIKVRAADGSGDAETLDSGPRVMTNDWSRDGRYLVYMKFLKGVPSLWVYDFREKKPSPLPTPIPAAEGSLSPDGRWLAFTSTHRGGVDVFVQPFPGPGPRIQISNSGGTQSRWRADGKELFYIGARNQLMAVSVQAGKILEVGPPAPLFTTRIHGARYSLFQYAVTPDGQRFLINSLPREDAAAPMTLLTDWAAELKH